MDFVVGFPEDTQNINGGLCRWVSRRHSQDQWFLVFLYRFSKMVHLYAVSDSITAHGCARVFIDTVFRLHGLPR